MNLPESSLIKFWLSSNKKNKKMTSTITRIFLIEVSIEIEMFFIGLERI